MKKSFLLISSLVLLLFSCKKHDDNSPSPNKAYNVKFVVSNFTQHIVDNSSARLQVNDVTSITPDVASKLYYVVYNSSGAFVSEIVQTSDQANFGTISSTLPAGTYTILMVAGTNNMILSGFDGMYGSGQSDIRNYNITTFGTTLLTYSIFSTFDTDQQVYFTFRKWGDTFYKKFQVTVSGTTISQNVTLDRIVGKVRLHVLDAIPANAATFKATIGDEDKIDVVETFAVFTRRDNGTDIKYKGAGNVVVTLPDSVKGKTGANVDVIVANTTRPFSYSFAFYDTSGKLLANQIKVDNVTCQRNKSTILTGKVFDQSSSTLQISLGDFDSTPLTTIHF